MRFFSYPLQALWLSALVRSDGPLVIHPPFPPFLDFDAAQARLSLGSTIRTELGPLLSPDSSILLPDSPGFAQTVDRWQEYRKPDIAAAVRVATEGDIQQTILYANHHNIPILAKGAGHGFNTNLGNVKHGIEINTRSMNSVQVAEDGKTARIGAGASSREEVDGLWAAGKQTTTGFCDCTGLAGVLLGGGHGILQGKYGLAADNLVAARVVLANGSLVTASSTSHPDLFWALRGAGHNFGVVAEFTLSVHDAPSGAVWAHEQFVFHGDQLESLFAHVNALQNEGTVPPVELSIFVEFLRLPGFDPAQPIILVIAIYEGTLDDLRPFTAAFHAMSPLNAASDTSNLLELSRLIQASVDGIVCQHGSSMRMGPVHLDRYNLTAQRLAFDAFAALTSKPAFAASSFLFEGYSLNGVQAVPAESTAFADRASRLLVTPVVYYKPDSALDGSANDAAVEMQRILQAGSGRSQFPVYVNYARGDETPEQLYGFEPWRLERLRALKRAYDPLNTFRFYAPIIG